MFENKKLEVGCDAPVHITRLIASWHNVGGEFDYGGRFEGWLKSLGLDRNTVADIQEMALCGKMELERSARAYIKQHPEEWDD